MLLFYIVILPRYKHSLKRICMIYGTSFRINWKDEEWFIFIESLSLINSCVECHEPWAGKGREGFRTAKFAVSTDFFQPNRKKKKKGCDCSLTDSLGLNIMDKEGQGNVDLQSCITISIVKFIQTIAILQRRSSFWKTTSRMPCSSLL